MTLHMRSILNDEINFKYGLDFWIDSVKISDFNRISNFIFMLSLLKSDFIEKPKVIGVGFAVTL